MEQTERLKSLLAEQDYRVTKPRLEVFKALAVTHDPLSTVEIANQLQGAVDRVSVYRVIDVFEKVGIIHRVWMGFKSKVELSEAFSPHHHHFTCIKCGKTTGLRSEGLENELGVLEKANNFTLTHHSIELKGICEGCQKTAEQTIEQSSAPTL